MTRYGQPPKDTRFKKGQSGNPNGRPKGTGTKLTASAKATLAAGAKMMTMRENGVAREIPVVRGIEFAQQKSALAGSSLAQKHFLDRYRAAEIEERAAREADLAWGEEFVAGLRWLREVAATQGRETSMPYPHPDDVVLDPERGVRFVGPMDAEQNDKLEWALKARDVLFAQDVFDRRCWNGAEDDDPDTGPGTAAVLAWLINDGVPKRQRLDEMDVTMMTMRYERMTKRAMSKYLYQAWKSLRLSIPRGAVFIPVGKGKQLLTTVIGMASGKIPIEAN